MTTLSDDAWNVVDVPDAQGQNCWYDSMAENDLDVGFALASRTSGCLYLDDIVFAPMTPIDGAFYALVGGATPFKAKDVFTVTDSESTRGITIRPRAPTFFACAAKAAASVSVRSTAPCATCTAPSSSIPTPNPAPMSVKWTVSWPRLALGSAWRSGG
jgi:hypothetical protein